MADEQEGEKCRARALTGLQFYNRRKSGEGRRPALSFSTRRHASIIGSASRLSRGISCPYMVKLGPQITSFHGWREHVLGLINLLSSLAGCGPHATLFYCVRAGPGLLLNGFVAKPACLVLWLSNPAFSVIINFQGSLKFSVNTSPVGVTVQSPMLSLHSTPVITRFYSSLLNPGARARGTDTP